MFFHQLILSLVNAFVSLFEKSRNSKVYLPATKFTLFYIHRTTIQSSYNTYILNFGTIFFSQRLRAMGESDIFFTKNNIWFYMKA